MYLILLNLETVLKFMLPFDVLLLVMQKYQLVLS